MRANRSGRMSDEITSTADDPDPERNETFLDVLEGLINSGRLGRDVHPKKKKGSVRTANTQTLDKSTFSLLTKQLCGIAEPRFRILQENNITRMIRNRERGGDTGNGFSPRNKCRITDMYIPNKKKVLEKFVGKIFCSIHSKDGKILLTASQDRNVRLYNSSKSYEYVRTICADNVCWSILDVDIHPQQNNFVYSTWEETLYLCSLEDEHAEQTSLKIKTPGSRSNFCIFSVRFSSDGREVIGGSNHGCIHIYDLEEGRQVMKFFSHPYDVNSVVYADDSGQIIYSGGDDNLVKVWDKRTLGGDKAKPVGTLAAHLEGITFIDPKGDGRHLISNSKDQSIKLWDVRAFSGKQAIAESLKMEMNWDYRYQDVPKVFETSQKLRGDTSLMTYQGHKVVRTLIRARFSPMHTTGQRYIYTGCGTGRVIIFDSLTGNIVESLKGHKSCVRDVSWHPTKPEIISTSWDGTMAKWDYSDKQARWTNSEGGRKPFLRLS